MSAETHLGLGSGLLLIGVLWLGHEFTESYWLCVVVAFDVERKRFYESIASCFATWITGSCLGPYSYTRICA